MTNQRIQLTIQKLKTNSLCLPVGMVAEALAPDHFFTPHKNVCLIRADSNEKSNQKDHSS